MGAVEGRVVLDMPEKPKKYSGFNTFIVILLIFTLINMILNALMGDWPDMFYCSAMFSFILSYVSMRKKVNKSLKEIEQIRDQVNKLRK